MIVGRRSSPVAGIVLAVSIPLLFAIGIGLRLWLWPAAGPTNALDELVRWTHEIAVAGWGTGYEQNPTLPPVLSLILAALAAAEPAFRSVSDASDPAIRALVKVPPSLADLAIAAAVGWWFRGRPWAALGGVAVVLLWPVPWVISAWWGVPEALVVLPAVLALLAARARLPILVAALTAISLMTGPVALPFLVPIGAWYLGAHGFRGLVKGIGIGAITFALVGVPFVAANGPVNWLGHVGAAAGTAASRSPDAWNPSWAIEALGAGGDPLAASTTVLGQLAYRDVGLVLFGILAVVVFVGVYRRRTAQALAMGLAAISLASFVCLTGRQATDAYAAFVFLLMAINGRVLLVAWAVFAVTLAANLLFAAPPPGLPLPDERSFGLVGAAVVTLVALIAVLWTLLGERERRDRDDVGQPLHSIWPLSMR